jgi:hypothetical protein
MQETQNPARILACSHVFHYSNCYLGDRAAM